MWYRTIFIKIANVEKNFNGECSENIDGDEIIHNDYRNVWNSCIVYIVLLVIALLTIIGISSAYFYFNWYLKGDITCVKFSANTQTTIYWTYKWETSNKLT